MARKKGSKDRAFRSSLWIAFAAISAGALVIDFSHHHFFVDGDATVPILTSLIRWTPYYWQVNHFGMLVPLLALPVHSPLANLMVQNFFTAFGLLATFFLMAGAILGEGAWLIPGALSSSWYTLLLGRYHGFYGPSHLYGTALGLGMGGFILFARAGKKHPAATLAGAIILEGLALWLTPATVFYLFPLILLGPRRAGLRRSAIFAGSCIVLFFLHLHWSSLSIYSLPAMRTDSPEHWLGNWSGLFEHMREDYLGLPSILLIGLAAIIGFAGSARATGRRVRSRDWRPFIAALAAGAAYFIGIGLASWPRSQQLSARFVFPCYLWLTVAATCFAVEPWHRRASALWRKRAAWASLALFLVSPMIVYGVPLPGNPRAALEEANQEYGPDALRSGCDYMIGTYTTVWKTVFYVRWKRYESGDPKPFWGITDRGFVTADLWRATPSTCFLVADGDDDWRNQAQIYRLPELLPGPRYGKLQSYRLP